MSTVNRNMFETNISTIIEKETIAQIINNDTK